MFFHHEAESFVKKITTVGVQPIILVPPIFIALLCFLFAYDSKSALAAAAATLSLMPFWLPLLILNHLWITWIHYIRFKYWREQEHVLLEVDIPQEIFKSPLAMELFLTTLHNAGGESTFIDRLWKGKFRTTWSLEIASNEGKVSFYMYMRKAFRNMVEARLYGQYPEVRVREVPDYVRKVPFNLEKYDIFGVEYQFNKPDPYPIKTYLDFGLDKDPKEEFKIDPIANTLEMLGHIGKGEYFWFQIIMAPRKKDQWFGFYSSVDSLKESGKKEIENIVSTAAKRSAKIYDSEEGQGKTAQLTDGEKRAIEAIELKLSKLIFECGIRVIYLAEKEHLVGINNGQVIRFFDHIKSNEFNGISPTRGLADLDYPWQDWNGMIRDWYKRHMYSWYRDRAYFYVPYDQKPIMLNTEEIATLWHFPGSAVQTPNLVRSTSRSGGTPPNLPL